MLYPEKHNFSQLRCYSFVLMPPFKYIVVNFTIQSAFHYYTFPSINQINAEAAQCSKGGNSVLRIPNDIY